VVNDYTLASELDRQFGDLPVGLRKMMLLFLNPIHGFAGNLAGSFTFKSVVTVEGQHACNLVGGLSDELTSPSRQDQKSTASQEEAG
jgi:hypothetical protein